jgi:uncharacterized protein
MTLNYIEAIYSRTTSTSYILKLYLERVRHFCGLILGLVEKNDPEGRDMPQGHQSGSGRGFAGMSERKQREIASKGGSSVPNEKRSFSKDHELAAEAGRKGGAAVPDDKRSFSKDHELAAEAGRKGGQNVPDDERSFSRDRALASEAGRKGGQS